MSKLLNKSKIEHSFVTTTFPNPYTSCSQAIESLLRYSKSSSTKPNLDLIQFSSPNVTGLSLSLKSLPKVEKWEVEFHASRTIASHSIKLETVWVQSQLTCHEAWSCGDKIILAPTQPPKDNPNDEQISFEIVRKHLGRVWMIALVRLYNCSHRKEGVTAVVLIFSRKQKMFNSS